MATLTTDGLNEFAVSLGEIAGLPDSVVNEMLTQGGEVIVRAQKSACPKRTGKLADSIKLGKMRRSYDGASIEIKPEGTHHTTKGTRGKGKGRAVRNAEVAFILEYGAKSRNIAPRQWMQKANEGAADQAVEAERKALDGWLESKGF